jgi:transposase
VHELLQAGRSQREIAEILGLSRNTAARFAREPDPAALLVKATGRESKLDRCINNDLGQASARKEV